MRVILGCALAGASPPPAGSTAKDLARLEIKADIVRRSNETRVRLCALLVIAGGAVFSLSSALVFGLGLSDSSVTNVIWMDGFSAALRRGEFPPRWLPEAFEGLGAPSFYFYPPLAFYLGGLLDAASGWRLDGAAQVVAVGLAASFASGAAMFAWLRSRVGAAGATIAAVAYQLTPFHLLDFYLRGALGECLGYAILPLLVMAMRAAAGSLRGTTALAAAYAALIYSHLPTALLVSLTLVPAYGLRLAFRRDQEVLPAALRLAFGLGLGLALSTSYLWPALALQSYVRMDLIWIPYFEAWRWAVSTPAAWPGRPMIFGPISWSLAAAALLVASLAFLNRSDRGPDRRSVGAYSPSPVLHSCACRRSGGSISSRRSSSRGDCSCRWSSPW